MNRSRSPWTTADRIALIIGSVALALTLYQLAEPPLLRYLTQPVVTINSPLPGFVSGKQGFNVTGTARRIPDASDLWLIVRAPDGFWYPISILEIANQEWSVARHMLCYRLGPGQQDLQIWMVPQTTDGPLISYLSVSHTSGIVNLPPEAVLETSRIVLIPDNVRVSC
jgi:hypothetical protein